MDHTDYSEYMEYMDYTDYTDNRLKEYILILFQTDYYGLMVEYTDHIQSIYGPFIFFIFFIDRLYTDYIQTIPPVYLYSSFYSMQKYPV